MTNIILALFIHPVGTPVRILAPVKYYDCRGTIAEVEEFKEEVYYHVQLSNCNKAKLKGLDEKSFETL